jgi:hypothetical protein
MISEAELLAVELASINIRLRLVESRLGALETDVFPPRKVPRLDDPAPPTPTEAVPPPPTAELISQESTEE